MQDQADKSEKISELRGLVQLLDELRIAETKAQQSSTAQSIGMLSSETERCKQERRNQERRVYFRRAVQRWDRDRRNQERRVARHWD